MGHMEEAEVLQHSRAIPIALTGQAPAPWGLSLG